MNGMKLQIDSKIGALNDMWECVMSVYEFDERIEYGLKNKNKGNELFKQMRYNAAIKNDKENDNEND